MTAIRKCVRTLAASERGATAIEYGLIVALIAMACVGALSQLGGGANGMWTKIANKVETAG